MIHCSTVWKKLQAHHDAWENLSLSQLFADDPERFSKYSAQILGVLVDYSKQMISTDTLQLFSELVDALHLSEKIEALFSPQVINHSEQRAACYPLLRMLDDTAAPLFKEGSVYQRDVLNSLSKIESFVDAIFSGKWLGTSGNKIKDIVNVGIGGSHLGPEMLTRALTQYQQGHCQCHYLSNIDPLSITSILKTVDPATTLFIISSKSMQTTETLSHASLIIEWLGSDIDINKHIVAVTANPDKASSVLGLAKENIFPIWDWVGGRYSVWSAIGLPLALSIGMTHFKALLSGAHQVDVHFKQQAMMNNIPVLLGLLDVWNINFFKRETLATLVYSDSLSLLPQYLQQLIMESNGKSVTQDARLVDYQTAPIVWGGIGTNFQHSAMQLFLQGTHALACDFISVCDVDSVYPSQQAQLYANCLAQSQALMRGLSEKEVARHLEIEGFNKTQINKQVPYKMIPGNTPSNTLVLKSVTPENLGVLLALYEHRTFVQAAVWDINPFDQYGVELSKGIAKEIYTYLDADSSQRDYNCDASTRGLLQFYLQD